MFETKSVKVDKAFSGDEGTDSFVLPRGRAISAIRLVARGKNAATHNAPDACATEDIISAIKKVEIYSGDRVFQSMSGEIIKAFDTYKNGRDNYTNLTQIAGGTYPSGWSEAVFHLIFPDTRWIWDAAYLRLYMTVYRCLLTSISIQRTQTAMQRFSRVDRTIDMMCI